MTPPGSTEGTHSFSIELFARWPDMDFNQHMRNAAYLGASEDCRMSFLDSHGFTMKEFQKRTLGPVVVEDRLVYEKELRLLSSSSPGSSCSSRTRSVTSYRVPFAFETEPPA